MLKDRRVLVVEDNKQDIERGQALLNELMAISSVCRNVAEAKRAIREESFDFLLCDLHIETRPGFEKPDGLHIIALAKEQQPNMVIVANSSDPRADIWTEALAAGAQHFIRKPLTRADELTIAFSLAKERKALVAGASRKKVFEGHWLRFAEKYPDGIVIDHATLSKAKGLARRNTTTSVLIGETGTGKEEVARLIHRFRCQAEGQIPFVAVNCATITEGLTESLLFGHRKGSFTGASETTSGYVADADGGILFLDEIHALELRCQQKLLRVLADGTYNRLGETRTYHSRFQLVAATTKDLDDEVEDGHFMLDLRNRITGIDITLLPLRDRKHDIDALVALFLNKNEIRLSDNVLDELCGKLKTYYWQGNIRQLFKVLESWVLHCEFQDVPLTVELLPFFKGMKAPSSKETACSEESTARIPPKNRDEILRLISAFTEDFDYETTTENFERLILTAALERHASIGKVCQVLNIPRSTLDSKRRKYKLD